MKTEKIITRKDYMTNSSELHHAYYAQFVTDLTKRFVLNSLSIEHLVECFKEDKHLNNCKIPFNNMGRGGRWWWDLSPINESLMTELNGRGRSQSTYTCIGKAAARILIEEHLNK